MSDGKVFQSVGAAMGIDLNCPAFLQIILLYHALGAHTEQYTQQYLLKPFFNISIIYCYPHCV